MSPGSHRVYISFLVGIVLFTTVFLILYGLSYYATSIGERFFHENYNTLKPSGFVGHGLGIIGTLLIIIGISSYMLRKRNSRMKRWGLLKHWLEFHIFLCTLGPILILFHTTFKFGGIVSISFWSMVAVFLSGIIGRFIYIQIPRSIEGRELSLSEVKSLKMDMRNALQKYSSLDPELRDRIVESTSSKSTGVEENSRQEIGEKASFKMLKKALRSANLSGNDYKSILRTIKREYSLNRRIRRLDIMKNLFKYWHVAHLPFALVMLIIMVIHVAITLTLGYKWIF